MTELLAELGRNLPSGRIISDPDLLEGYRRDQSALSPSGHAQAAVIARSVSDVQTVLALANDHRVPVVTRGAGSGLAGGANAVDGSIILVMSSMDTISDLSRIDLCATVQPGVLNNTVKEAAARANLFYPPDPASSAFCTIGGNIATNAGGLCCMKYGVTKDYVMALDVVVSGGRLLRTGSAARKSSAGYDLTSLMVGSEGTLGVIVGATLRLVPRPESPATVVATFPALAKLGELPGRLAEAGITPSMLEVIDRTTINAIEDRYPMGLDRSLGAILIAQADSPNREEEASLIATAANRVGATEALHTADPIEADMLLQARKLAYPALEGGERSALLDDVAVPISQIPRMVDRIAQIGEQHRVVIAVFGHLGDGNLHPTILYNHLDAAEVAKARGAFDGIVHAALDIGGTATGEHGIGNLKSWHLGRQLDETAAQMHFDIKKALDPKAILNPGKALPMLSSGQVP